MTLIEMTKVNDQTRERKSYYLQLLWIYDQLYFDGMTIDSCVGFHDLFLNITRNPNCPEIVRLLSPMGLKPHDHPYIISRVFKLTFEEFVQDLRKKHILDKYSHS
ncbi:hypothetical protein Lal_00024360 [Lupinus albus]|nr:hypothetical protein Lal_00024360 [Lupinus albus]